MLYSRASLFVLLILIAITARGTWGVYKKEKESQRQLDRMTQELAAIAAREESLRTATERLKTPEGIEAEIREQFQVAKQGERMIVVVENKKGEAETTVPDKSLLSSFFDIFR